MNQYEIAAKELVEKFKPHVAGWIKNNEQERAIACALIHVEGLIAERKRSVDTVKAFYDKHRADFNNQSNAGLKSAFISEKIANECMYIKNAIAGQTSLGAYMKAEEHWSKIKTELLKMKG